ncbi:MAG: T9SS type A sorting domain-containing protein [Flavobacteriales bacterium]|nr:T9SS type A sorting domain-containing protein [Flavobacteriales bacterium]
MIRTLLAAALGLPLMLHAASGGPDDYGYIWKDSDEPGGPVFDWIDITSSGVLVTGLADDNFVGPFVMQTNMPYYWYTVKNMWIGSNGYLVFNPANEASPFPIIPQAGGMEDYIAALTADLTFTGAGNPGACYVYDSPDTTIVSYVNVPFWQQAAPSYTGSNTFQVILNKADSTITIQFQEQMGLTQNNDIVIGIESLSGDIGLQHSADTYPVANYAIRFYAPAVPLLDITDAAMEWLSEAGSRGKVLQRNGPAFPMTLQVLNTGNQSVSNVQVLGQVLNAGGQVQATGTQTIALLDPGVDTMITFPDEFMPAASGTYRFTGNLSGIPNELVLANNSLTQELTVYDTSSVVLGLDWAGTSDDGVGIGWAGGNGGAGVYLEAPYYPCLVTATTIRIASNLTPVGYYMKVYDDDGVGGGPGTLLDSVFVQPADAGAGDNSHPLSSPLTWTEGGLYVSWEMGGENVNIATDIIGPFSLHSFEILDNVWAEYRDRTTEDFHLGLRVEQEPVLDIGCTNYFGLIDGLDLTQPTVVRVWIRNFGNQVANGFPVSYQFASEPVVTENYSGPAIPPGDSSLFSFNAQFLPLNSGAGAFCAWSDLSSDMEQLNDTICVTVNVIAGIFEPVHEPVELVPNPASDRVTLMGVPAGPYRLDLVDLTGRSVFSERFVMGDRHLLDVSRLTSGTYHLQMLGQGSLYTGKLIVAERP